MVEHLVTRRRGRDEAPGGEVAEPVDKEAHHREASHGEITWAEAARGGAGRGGAEHRGTRCAGESSRSSWRSLVPPQDEVEPRPVGESLDRVARRLGAPPVRALGAVFSRWEEAVSPAVADHAWPISLVGGTLVIAVDQAAWATQLRFLAPTIVSRLGELSGTDAVERVEVQVRRRPS